MSDNIRNKMLRFQAEPPASAWEGIAAELDAEKSLPKKLFNYQQQPNDAVWNKIADRLDDESNTKVVPLKRFSNSFKYAAAAAVIAAVALSVFYFYPSNNKGHIAQQKAQQKSIPNITANTSITNSQNNTTAITNQNDQEQLSESNRQTAASVNSYAVVPQKGFKKVDIEIPIHALAAKVPDVVPAYKNIINEEVADRYMIATNTQGDVVRLPKKAYSDFACADAVAANTNTPCKQNVETLQSKMAASMATDFAHFLDLLKNLQETR